MVQDSKYNTNSIEEILQNNYKLIEEFLNNPDYNGISCLEIEYQE